MNLYRGCQHGCIYCDSRSDCYHMDHAFEDIAVKENALILLEDALRRKRRPCMIGTGSMSDPYMPLEAELGFTRRALELICRYGFGATLITKSDRVLRDLDLLQAIHDRAKCTVQMTLTTYDEELCRKIEPNVCTTKKRFEMLMAMKAEGIPTVVWIDPILPYINDTKENLDGILEYCIRAEVKGIICFGIGMTLRNGNREYFYQKLDEHFPGLKRKYQERYGLAYEIESPNGRVLYQRLQDTCRAHGILCKPEAVFDYIKEFPEDKNYKQLSLFEE